MQGGKYGRLFGARNAEIPEHRGQCAVDHAVAMPLREHGAKDRKRCFVLRPDFHVDALQFSLA